ncbi:MAG: DUF4082 domain-containing protein, partial [Cryobacterium sp.]|nr:DUF4082 domain-containing protein [Cryobacterium sp.]
LNDAGGVSVTGATSYDAAAKTATFTPSVNLARGGSYTASVRAASPTGAAMDAPATWSFTTAQPSPVPGVCPCGIWDDGATPQTVTANDAGNVELGVKFTADVNGKVTGVRFYKGPENVGIHTGSLWSASGALLATTTFSGESSTGWQTASFSTPVDVTAGTTYFASYRAPGGRYSVDSGGLAGVVEASPLRTVASGGAYTYSVGFPSNSTTANYWVDVIFTRTG